MESPWNNASASCLQPSIFWLRSNDDLQHHPARDRHDRVPQEDHQERCNPHQKTLQVVRRTYLKCNTRMQIFQNCFCVGVFQGQSFREARKSETRSEGYSETQVRATHYTHSESLDSSHGNLPLSFRWFEGFNWEGLRQGSIEPPYTPTVSIPQRPARVRAFTTSVLPAGEGTVGQQQLRRLSRGHGQPSGWRVRLGPRVLAGRTVGKRTKE